MMDYFSTEQVKYILLLKDLQGYTIDAIFQDDTPEQRYNSLIKVFLGLENALSKKRLSNQGRFIL